MVKDYPSQKNPVMILVISDLLFLIVEKNVKKKAVVIDLSKFSAPSQI